MRRAIRLSGAAAGAALAGAALPRLVSSVALVLAVSASAAQGPVPIVDDRSANPLGGQAAPLADAALAATRGGFQAGGGLLLSFGLVRSVAVDGTVVATTTLVVSNSGGAVAPGGPSAIVAGPGSAAGTTVATGTTGAGMLTLVQNAQDGRRIQTTTLIDATVNSLSLLRQSTLQSTLRGAVIDSLRR